tara:strand:- start:773 stop:1444 length:672 start_codon:yes stop_codon:yes gene_type:complete
MFINVLITGATKEIAVGTIFADAYKFWTSDNAKKYFNEYMWCPDWFIKENSNLAIPEYAKLPSWYEVNDLYSEVGFFYDQYKFSNIIIREVDKSNNIIQEIYNNDVGNFVDEYDLKINWKEVYFPTDRYILCSTSVEAKTIITPSFDSTKEIDHFDLANISFSGLKIYQHNLITSIDYKDAGTFKSKQGSKSNKSNDITSLSFFYFFFAKSFEFCLIDNKKEL